MGYRNNKRIYGSVKGYQKLFFIETPTRIYGPWYISPKARLKNLLKEEVDAIITKFEYDPELGVYRKEYIEITAKDLA